MNSETNENMATNDVEELEKEWTVMIYMAGDNNLSADMAYALADIREAMKDKGDQLNLMVYYDGAAFNAPTYYCDFTDEKPLYCPAQSVKKVFEYARQTSQQRGGTDSESDENSGAVYPLMNFINWCVNDTQVTKYKKNEDGTYEKKVETHRGRKAKKYALILSGHGSGFKNMSLMLDSSSNYYLTIPKLRWALEEITKSEPTKKQPTLLLKQKIDILGFDSCVMGMAEIAYEFRKVVKTIVASEGSIPSAGWTYGNLLSNLIVPVANKKAVTDEKAVAKGFVQNFIEKQSEFMIGGVSVDLAALDLTKIEPVIKTANNLGRALSAFLKMERSPIPERLKRALLLTHWECQSYMSEQNVDLKDFCEVLAKHIEELPETNTDKKSLIQPSNGKPSLCKQVIDAVDNCVLFSGFSGGAYQYSNGLAIFFPWTRLSYRSSQRDYEKLQAIKRSKDANVECDGPLREWNQFLKDFTSLTVREAREVLETNATQTNLPPTGVIPNDEQTDVYVRPFFPTRNNGTLNDRDNGTLNDRDNGTLNDRNNGPLNDRNNGTLNDRGLQMFLMTQFKNTDSPWNISGFTKDVDQPEKVEEPPNEAA